MASQNKQQEKLGEVIPITESLHFPEKMVTNLPIRISRRQKSLFYHAAKATGMTISSFLRVCAMEKAVQILPIQLVEDIARMDMGR